MKDKIIKRGEKTASRVIEGEAIIFTPEDSMIHSLNEVGTRIWELLEEEKTIDEIVSVICEEFEVEKDKAEQDIDEFIELLSKKGITEITNL